MVISILYTMLYLVTLSWPNNEDRYGFSIVRQYLNPARKWVVTPMIFVPLSHQWACLARPIIVVVCGVHIWV